MVQEEMVRRAHLNTGTGKRRVYSGKYALSSIVVCAHCGDIFRRTHWNVHGRKRIVWRCASRLHKKDTDFNCQARTLTEAELHLAVVEAVNDVYARQDVFLPQLKANMARVLSNNNSEKLAELGARLADLGQEMILETRKNTTSKELGEESDQLREEKYRLLLEDAEKESTRKKIEDMEKAITEFGGKVREYDDALVRRLVERITVYDDHITVEFKSGIETEVKM